MPINEEIIKSHSEDLAYKMRGAITDDERNPYTFEDVITEIDTMLNEARADTAKQIFEEIESTGILLMGRGYTESERKFEALKKKYKVD